MERIEEILKYSEKIEVDDFTKSYPHIISFYENKNKLTIKDVIAGAYIVYGWMPTMLKKIDFETEDICSILNKVREKEESILNHEVSSIKKLTNNSVVGASKLLHLIKPDKFPIWDSRIHKFLYKKEGPYTYQVNSVKNYMRFIEDINVGITHKNFDKAHKIVNKRLGYPVTAIRALELLIFQKQKSDP